MRKSLDTMLLFVWMLVAAPVQAQEWGIAGAGNATCEHWLQNNRTQQSEIVGWIAGFMTAVNFERSSERNQPPPLRLKLLSDDYLRGRSTRRADAETTDPSLWCPLLLPSLRTSLLSSVAVRGH